MVMRRVGGLDDPIWDEAIPRLARQPRKVSIRSPLLCSLIAASMAALSTALPWFVSAENPPMNSFSRWLVRGWHPGYQGWGWILLALSLLLVVGLAVAVWRPRAALLGSLLCLGVLLLAAALLEAVAHPSLDPGPDLHAAWGAWIGVLAAVVACAGMAAGIGLVIRDGR